MNFAELGVLIPFAALALVGFIIWVGVQKENHARSNLKRRSFELWRERVKGRKTKHRSTSESTRFKSADQK